MADFRAADDLFQHLSSFVPQLPDQTLASKYAGFAAVAAVATYEVNIKNRILDFCRQKHSVFGNFAEKRFNQINGRIKLQNISDDYILPFGKKYKERWTKMIKEEERKFQRQMRRSLKNSYSNLITWRNEFAHQGSMPMYATFFEVSQAYEDGKTVIECFEKTLRR